MDNTKEIEIKISGQIKGDYDDCEKEYEIMKAELQVVCAKHSLKLDVNRCWDNDDNN